MLHYRIIALLGVAGVALAAPFAAAQKDHSPVTADDLAAILRQKAIQAVAGRDIPAGYWLMDGDMQMPLSFNPLADGFYLTNLWPGGVVPFTFAAGFSSADINNIIGAMFVWQGLANVTFIGRSTQADWVLIQLSTGNNSAVGRTGGQQVINFATNQATSVYVHELGHCLGFLHEHQRGDRPLDIFPCNVANVVCSNGVPTSTGNPYDANFPIIPSGTHWASYDFASIMHYPRCAFSPVCPSQPCNCTTAQETMHVQQPFTAQWNSVIGTASGPSYLDGITMRGLYPNASDRWNDFVSGGSPNGSFQNPWGLNVAVAAAQTPAGGTLYLKSDTTYHAVGMYSNPVTIVSPAGIATLGN